MPAQAIHEQDKLLPFNPGPVNAMIIQDRGCKGEGVALAQASQLYVGACPGGHESVVIEIRIPGGDKGAAGGPSAPGPFPDRVRNKAEFFNRHDGVIAQDRIEP